MSTLTATPSTPAPARPWWREPYVWLVIGGPLTVVIAGIATVVIAVKNPDPLLDRAAGQTRATTPEAAYSNAPASQARNHATTATLPAKP